MVEEIVHLLGDGAFVEQAHGLVGGVGFLNDVADELQVFPERLDRGEGLVALRIRFASQLSDLGSLEPGALFERGQVRRHVLQVCLPAGQLFCELIKSHILSSRFASPPR
jgi:hypothetical protein